MSKERFTFDTTNLIFNDNTKGEFLDDIEVCELLNQQQQRIAELEEQIKNAIVPKLIEGCKYFAVCSLVKEEVCPICNGNFRKMAIENGFKGELKCSNCDCGKISKIEWQIIPFTLKYAHYDKDGNVSYDNEVTIDCELSGYQHFSGGLYLDDNSDYMSSWQYKICEEEKIFRTEKEAQAKLKELQGE